MITFFTDYNLGKIKVNSKLFNLSTKHNYRIYGLGNVGNPDVYIQCNDDFDDDGKFDKMKSFFQKNGLNVDFDVSYLGEDVITIGIRRELRKNIVFCSCLLQTIIYYLEDRLELDLKYKIPGIEKIRL